VYCEEFQYIDDAIAREKQLKNWHRQWKINLIEEHNPNWENLWKGDAGTDAETIPKRRDSMTKKIKK
jgi:hypothetical protein